MLVKNWKRVLLIGYSTWAFIAAALCFALPDLIYYLFTIDTNPVIWGRLGLMFACGGLVGRLIEQKDETKWHRRIVVGAVLIAAFSLSLPAMAHTPANCQSTETQDFDTLAVKHITRWEGRELVAYLDTIAKPPVPTICSGITRGVRMGDVKTDDECDALLLEEIHTHRDGLHRALTARTKLERLPVTRDVALTSWTFNIGVGAATKSTAVRRLNRGNIKGACEATAWFTRSGGRIVRGLVNRRNAEKELCLIGL